MTNKEWLEQIKKFDEISEFRSDDSSNPYEFRKTKALEIIAEELIKLNKTVNELKKVDMMIKYGQEETRPENGDWEVRVKKDGKDQE